MAAVRWLRDNMSGHSWSAAYLEKAIERGEVLPAARKGKRT
jgi:hypothetical protein